MMQPKRDHRRRRDADEIGMCFLVSAVVVVLTSAGRQMI